MDVLKVRMQMHKGVNGAPASALGMLRSMLRSEGPGALMAGVQASVMREMSYSGIRMGLYDEIKELLAGETARRAHPVAVCLARALWQHQLGNCIAHGSSSSSRGLSLATHSNAHACSHHLFRCLLQAMAMTSIHFQCGKSWLLVACRAAWEQPSPTQQVRVVHAADVVMQ
jgi:hypothetical protein